MTHASTCPAAVRTDVPARVGGTCAVIAAGGQGERFGDPRGKQFVEICGLPMVSWSLLAFDAAPSIGSIVVVCPAARVDEMRTAAVEPLRLGTPVLFADAGGTRQASCLSGLRAVPRGFPLVAIHDGARPLVTVAAIERAVSAVRDDPSLAGAVCGQPAIDTLKLVEGDLVVATPDRSVYWAAQTPQVFRTGVVLAAHEAALSEGYVGTDDSSLVEHAGGRVLLVDSPRDNLKVTVPEDLTPVTAILEGRIAAAAVGEGPES